MGFLRAWFEAPFKMLAVLVGIYNANQARVARLMARADARGLWRGAVIVTALAWLVVWLVAGDEHGGRLTEAVREMFTAITK